MTDGPERLRVLSNRPIAPGHFVMELASSRIARAAAPGRFVQILVGDGFDPLLRRSFSFLDAGGKKFSVLYQVVGKGTAILAEKKKGDTLSVLGPFGNGFDAALARGRRVFLVGGGVGIPPLYHLAKNLRGARARAPGIDVFLGARKKNFLHCLKGFAKIGLRTHTATDDGSAGRRGFITEVLDNFLKEEAAGRNGGSSVVIYACGPAPMLKAVAALAQKFEAVCQISVEEPMPCGFGACLGCAVKVRSDRRPRAEESSSPEGLRSLVCGLGSVQYRYAMSCYEGPVFDAAAIVWER